LVGVSPFVLMRYALKVELRGFGHSWGRIKP
jgi:hypothetical protein